MNEGVQAGKTTRFVLIAVKHNAAYWTPTTIARALYAHALVDPPAEEGLGVLHDEVLRGLVGRAAERFWASDAVTPSNASAIRSACKALHELTIELYVTTAAELDAETAVGPTSKAVSRRARPAR